MKKSSCDFLNSQVTTFLYLTQNKSYFKFNVSWSHNTDIDKNSTCLTTRCITLLKTLFY